MICEKCDTRYDADEHGPDCPACGHLNHPEPVEPEPDYDPGPSLTDQYQAAWQSKFGPGGTHRRSQ